MSRAVATVVVFLLVVVWPGNARAHLMPAEQGTLNVVGDAVFAVLSVPVSALHDFDDDGDLVMSLKELQRHQDALRAEIDRRFAIADGGVPGATVRVDLVLSPQHDAPSDRSDQVVVLKHVQLAGRPKELRVTCDLFGARDAERQLTMTATRHPESGPQEVEAGTFTPNSPEHRYFRPLLPALLESIRTGAEHVLLGADHLLFLLTVIVAGLGWRYWFGVVTGFTAAHSVTLAAAALGYVPVAPRVVEPLIALSIVLMAIDNLVRKRQSVRQRVVLVCACGLLHGLGFAASMDALGLDTAHRIGGLVGFNLGVEVGQATFLVLVLGVLIAIRQLLPRLQAVRVTQLVSVLAAVTGSIWVVQRLGL